MWVIFAKRAGIPRQTPSPPLPRVFPHGVRCMIWEDFSQFKICMFSTLLLSVFDIWKPKSLVFPFFAATLTTICGIATVVGADWRWLWRWFPLKSGEPKKNWASPKNNGVGSSFLGKIGRARLARRARFLPKNHGPPRFFAGRDRIFFFGCEPDLGGNLN